MIKVLTRFRSEEEVNECDYRDAMEILQDDKEIFRVSDGEPEDSNLSRDFNDCLNVPNLLEKFYNLGKDGVKVEFEHEETDEI